MHYGVVKLSMLLNILQELRRSLVCAARLWITLSLAKRLYSTTASHVIQEYRQSHEDSCRTMALYYRLL